MSRRIAHWIIKNRLPVLLFILGSSAFFLYFELQAEIRHVEIFPPTEPNVQLHAKMVKIFGGTSTVFVAVEFKEGEVFDQKNLDKINTLHQKIKAMDGVVGFRIYSIVSPKFAHIYNTVDPNGIATIRSDRFDELYEQIRSGDEEARHLLRATVLNDPDMLGTIVSEDLKGTVIIANFWEEKDYPYIHKTLEKIIQEEEGTNTSIHIAGRAIMLGEIEGYFPYIVGLFGLAVLAMVSLLYIDFRMVRAVFLALSAGIMAEFWGMGFATSLGFELDVMSMTIPFLILALSHGHSVQMLSRFFYEFRQHQDRLKAAEVAIAGLLRPAAASLVANAAGFAFLALLPFPILASMAVVGSFGIAAILLTTFLYIPILSTYLPEPKLREERGKVAEFYNKVARGAVEGWSRKWVWAGAVALLAVGVVGSARLRVGELQQGSPYFWSDAKYNIAEKILREKFTGSDTLWIFAHGWSKEGRDILDPTFASDLYQLQMFLRERGDVRYTRSYVNFAQKASVAWHQMDPKWEIVPDSRAGIWDTMRMLGGSGGGSADDVKDLYEQNLVETNILTFVTDHRPETIDGILRAAEKFLREHKHYKDGAIELAAGTIGLYAAAMNSLRASQVASLVHMYGIDVFLTVIFFRSLIAGLLVLIPLTLGIFITYGIMGMANIGLFIYTLPVAALGLGVGVDYSFYTLSRLQEGVEGARTEEERRQGFIDALRFVGRAVFFTGITVTVAVVVLFFSPLRFHAMLGLAVAVIMMATMAGGTILIPTLVWVWRPRFVFGRS